MVGSQRLWRRAQVAWGDATVVSVFHSGAVCQRHQGGYRQHQPVAGDACRIGAPDLVPFPAHALDGLEAQFYPEAQSVPTHPDLIGGGGQVGEDDPGFVLFGVPDGQQGAAPLGLGVAEGGALADPGSIGTRDEALSGQAFAAVGAEGDVLAVAHTGMAALGAYLPPQPRPAVSCLS